ncbi:hypothetical protein C4559_01420 [Candidatus Microgenomates bacterium]|nr:MAG: hypothetical protein C4559_01420 [Candidatus Microgenomates bacterium]
MAEIPINPPPDAVQTPKAGENALRKEKKEITSQTRTAEVKKTARNAVNNRVNIIEKNKGLSNENEQVLWLVNTLTEDFKSGYSKKEGRPLVGLNEKGEIKTGENPLVVTVKNTEGHPVQVKIINVQAVNGDEFTCLAQFSENGNENRRNTQVSRQDLIDAQYVSEEAKIVQLFEGGQQEMVKTYIAIVKARQEAKKNNPDATAEEIFDAEQKAIEGLDEETLDRQIRGAAKELGMLRAETAQEIVKNHYSVTENGETKINKTGEAILELSEGANLLDAQIVSDILREEGCDFSKSSITKQVDEAQMELAKAEKVAETTGSPLAKEKVKVAKENLDLWQRASQALAKSESGDVVIDFFNQPLRKSFDPDKQKQIISSIESGNYEEAISLMLPGLEEDKRLALLQLGKKSGIGFFILSFLLNSVYGEISGGQQQ